MATKIESSEITQPKKVFVKSEQALDEMEANGQLEPFTDYYTDDEQDAPFMPIGSIFASAIPQTDARVHLLDGSTISQTGVYTTFANLIKALDAAGVSVTCTQDEFDTDVTTYGQCGKFVIDNDAGTIRLPLITEFIASNNGGQTIGLAQLDMFKSHEHGMDVRPAQYAGDWLTGHHNGSGYLPKQSSGNYYDASGTTATGGSETRPKNIRYPYYIVLASGYKSSQVVDIDNVMNEVNLKASKVKINTNMLGVPSNSNWVNISITADETYGIAPANGWILVRASSKNTNSWGTIYSYVGNTNPENRKIQSSCYNNVNDNFWSVCIPVKKDDTYKIHMSKTNFLDYSAHFVPAEEV